MNLSAQCAEVFQFLRLIIPIPYATIGKKAQEAYNGLQQITKRQ